MFSKFDQIFALGLQIFANVQPHFILFGVPFGSFVETSQGEKEWKVLQIGELVDLENAKLQTFTRRAIRTNIQSLFASRCYKGPIAVWVAHLAQTGVSSLVWQILDAMVQQGL